MKIARDHSKTCQQQVIHPKVVNLAKAIQHSDQLRRPLTVVMARQWGMTEALRLARNLN